MSPAQRLVDEIRDLTARAYGKRIELALLIGDRPSAEIYQSEMVCQITARRAAAFARAEEAGENEFGAVIGCDGQQAQQGVFG